MLDYIALGILIFTATSLLFGAIAIVDIPYKTALERNHPHQEAIYYAGWVSLFSLHAIWPLLWIWSAAYREDTVPRFIQINEDTAINDREASGEGDAYGGLDSDITDSVTLLRHKFEVLDDRIERIEKAILAATEAA